MTGERLDLDAIEARANAATAGPWFWSGTLNSMGPGPYLATWNRGSGLGKCMVMGSKRLGMRGAQPTFNVDGLMVPAVEIAEREVDYRDDIVNIKNPDAEFIAHAREDVPALITEVHAWRAAAATAMAVLVEARARHMTSSDPTECMVCDHDYRVDTGTQGPLCREAASLDAAIAALAQVTG